MKLPKREIYQQIHIGGWLSAVSCPPGREAEGDEYVFARREFALAKRLFSAAFSK
jgi:hypothetical protein